MNEKLDNQLNLALELGSNELSKSQELAVGYDPQSNSWDLIVRYNGNLDFLKEMNNVTVKELSGGYGIINIPQNLIEYVANREEIIFIEKPKALEFAVINGKRESCINEVQQPGFLENNSSGLFGEGIFVGIADSGIDYTNYAFRNGDGNTRIFALWDQVTNKVFSREDINKALMSSNPYELVNSRDLSGHGTHVAGIAAGNFATNKSNNLGIATKSELIIVKMAEPAKNSFPKTTQLMEAIDFMVKEANKANRPLALNISFGNTYGSHDGTSLLSTYLNYTSDSNRIVICVGSGNEGDSQGHSSGIITDTTDVEFQVSNYQKSFSIQLWKDYADIFEVEIISPSGETAKITRKDNNAESFILEQTDLQVFYGSPKPYSRYQEIFMEFIPINTYVNAGIWVIRIIPQKIVVGEYDMWFPTSASINKNTGFLRPNPFTTLTVPSATYKVITVGAYDSATMQIASFSGRGYTRENNQVKPDLVAPGVNIQSAAVGAGTTIKSGTSMATPFVTGSSALLMEWGIVKGNDKYLYGEKVKAYLIKGARQLPGYEQWPNPSGGWGSLCVYDSIPR